MSYTNVGVSYQDARLVNSSLHSSPEDSDVTDDGPVVEKPVYTAMAKCVGFPAGIAAKMVLDKEIQRTGMVYPFSADIYKPMLMRLDNEGIRAKEKSKFVQN